MNDVKKLSDDHLDHAREELRRAGFYDKDSDYGGMIPDAVLDVLRVFLEQGHSGGSAPIVAELVRKLMLYEPLTPLTGEDDEWVEVGEATGAEPIWQNRRCSHVFKGGDGQAYDVEGRVFREPSGCCYISGGSRVPVTFPYTPSREYVDVPAHGDAEPD